MMNSFYIVSIKSQMTPPITLLNIFEFKMFFMYFHKLKHFGCYKISNLLEFKESKL